ncbi:peptidase [Capnocytophaga sp. G2]|uniref:peptidase n=1 Tax=Capnocytophaga sp. G2 TaxID=3110695 RepID=UPI002B478997|nr:peptidase [Capnocytophaga sp. G2]MEB3005100.1 peptidase [Capnocytophaga sp. G2]
MAVESFFVIETSFSNLKERLKDEIVRVDKEYDEITVSYNGFFFWMYFYKEKEVYIDEKEKAKLLVNIKHESATPPTVITAFREKLLSLGFCER